MRGWRFGTSGIRALMGEGEFMLNRQSIASIAGALARLLTEDGLAGGLVIICYDSRANSLEFAGETAQIMSKAGFKVWLSPQPAPTPFLSFALRQAGAVAGVNITASHNPKEYNGCKIYGAKGAQIDMDFARRIQEELAIPSPKPLLAKESGDISPLPSRLEDDYLRLVLDHSGLSHEPDIPSALYTPLGGSGGGLMRRLAKMARCPLEFVEREMPPQEDLAGIARPNPLEREAFARAMALGRQKGTELLIATDPDADRCGAMLWQENDYRLLRGNEIGLILLSYLLERGCQEGRELTGYLVAQSLVSTPLCARICREQGLKWQAVPTGFRHIAGLIDKEPQKFLFGFEESGGFLATPELRDKDGLAAACLLLAAAAHFQGQGLDLAQVLEQIYRRYGRLEDFSYAVDCPSGQAQELLRVLRAAPPPCWGGLSLLRMVDYLEQQGSNHTDLLCFELTDGSSLYLRASGTEAKLRLYIFAPDQAAATMLWQTAKKNLGLP